MDGDVVNPKKFVGQLKKMQPETKALLFGEENKEALEVLEKVVNNLPVTANRVHQESSGLTKTGFGKSLLSLVRQQGFKSRFNIKRLMSPEEKESAATAIIKAISAVEVPARTLAPKVLPPRSEMFNAIKRRAVGRDEDDNKSQPQ